MMASKNVYYHEGNLDKAIELAKSLGWDNSCQFGPPEGEPEPWPELMDGDCLDSEKVLEVVRLYLDSVGWRWA